MDVSEQIVNSHKIYGASDNTNPAYNSVKKQLNYSQGNALENAPEEGLTVIPYTINYVDSVGLFGSENAFVKIKLNIIDSGGEDYEEIGWEGVIICQTCSDSDPFYLSADINLNGDPSTVNDFVPAGTNRDINFPFSPLVSIDLTNNKTNNIYNDSWFDVRLYTKERQPHPYDKMYVSPKDDYFYIGFHALNTRRLPYNVTCTIGTELISSTELTQENRRYIAKLIQ